MRFVVFRTRLQVVLRLLIAGGAAAGAVPWLRDELPDDFHALASWAPLLVVGGLIWLMADGFLGARVTPAHLELQYFVGRTRIPREEVSSVRLKVDTSVVFLEPNVGLDRSTRARQARLLDAATKYRAWVTARGPREYKSVRFTDEKRFHTLQRALQFAD